MGKLVGVDIGGTYTDLVILDHDLRRLSIRKISSTPQDPSVGLIDGLEADQTKFADIDLIIHATTVATNAVLERKGALCGLLATRGFRDVLELRRRDRPHRYGLWGTYEPLIPREFRLEVTERISAEGEVLVPLAESEVLNAGRELSRTGVEAIVISFLNAYANSDHELQAKQLLEESFPNLHVVAASQIAPLYREFERTSTGVLNAYVQPLMNRYLTMLDTQLESRGYDNDVLIMQSNGGVMTSRVARTCPVNTFLSGPAAGVIAAVQIAAESGFENLISYDMGGTSLDVSLVTGGEPSVSNGTELGFGMPLLVSMIDIDTLGAGGGSIARLDAQGLLQVGPESAGAEPGPVCYGCGGTDPTVTDAAVVLGQINPQYPIAGSAGFSFDVDRARTAISEKIGCPLQLSLEAAAAAILDIANHHIAGRIRRLTIDRGYDPRDFVLFSFGGAGSLFTSSLLKELGIPRGMVPQHPGITSAWGCVVADLRQDFVSMVNRRIADVDVEDLERMFCEHAEQGGAVIRRAQIPLQRITVFREADLSFEGQTHVIRTRLPSGVLTASNITESFFEAYRRRYGRVGESFRDLETLLERIPVRLLNLRTSVVGIRPELTLRELLPPPKTSLKQAQKGKRAVYVEGRLQECETFERALLPRNCYLEGPAVIEQPDTTIWLEPGVSAQVDEAGSLLIEVL